MCQNPVPLPVFQYHRRFIVYQYIYQSSVNLLLDREVRYIQLTEKQKSQCFLLEDRNLKCEDGIKLTISK